MDTVSSPSPEVPAKISRKRRSKEEPTEEQLREQLRTARRALDAFVKDQREKTIAHLGTLAYDAGLGGVSDDHLKEGFAALAKRLVGMLILALSLTACQVQTPLPTPAAAPTFPQTIFRHDRFFTYIQFFKCPGCVWAIPTRSYDVCTTAHCLAGL